jgi:hypothetical protein
MHQFTAMEAAVKLVSELATGPRSGAELRQVGIVLLRASGLGLLVLLFITAISVYKPWGLTPFGRRQWRVLDRANERAGGMPKWALWTAIAAGGASVAALVAGHLATMGGHPKHGH